MLYNLHPKSPRLNAGKIQVTVVYLLHASEKSLFPNTKNDISHSSPVIRSNAYCSQFGFNTDK